MKDKHDTQTQDMFKGPARTNAERQRAYRERQKQGQGQRLDIVLDSQTALKLELLCQYFSETKKFKIGEVVKNEFGYMMNVPEFKEFALANGYKSPTPAQKVQNIVEGDLHCSGCNKLIKENARYDSNTRYYCDFCIGY